MDIIEKLMKFGLSRPESNIYITLAQNGELTGYEVAKLTGFSRSNAYTSLAGLVEKGAAYVMEAQVTKYTPVSFQEFGSNHMKELETLRLEILSELPAKQETSDGYITIRGFRKIADKFLHMLSAVDYRVYLAVPHSILLSADSILKELAANGKKIVILTDEAYTLDGATVYITSIPDSQLRVIVDSAKIMTGELFPDEEKPSTCLYSQSENLVHAFKDMLQNQIQLIELAQSSSLQK